MSLAQFKEFVREQYLMLRLDQERAVATIPRLLARATPEDRAVALDLIRRVAAAGGEVTDEVKDRVSQVESMFNTAAGISGADATWKVAAAEGRVQVRRRASGEADERERAAKRKEPAAGEKHGEAE